MKTIYFDCFAGISGDMTLGALIDAGADSEQIISALKTIPVKGYEIDIRKEKRSHITGTRFEVKVSPEEKQPHRHLSSILEMINGSSISPRAKKDASGIFQLIGRAEAHVHGIPIEKVHFHEVGAVDSIVDIVGVSAAVDLLGIESFHSAPVPLGSGFVDTSHGRIPVPAPATIKILQGVDVRTGRFEGEMVTPTGAGILKYYCNDFSGKFDFKVSSVGYGVGGRNNEYCPSLLRVMLGEEEAPYLQGTMEVIETNIDDMNPVFYDTIFDKLFSAGALDAYITPLHMKKNRPGCLLTVLAEKHAVNCLSEIIFSETTTLGLRHYAVSKSFLKRKTIEAKTNYGIVQVKIAELPDGRLRFSPEYNNCKKLSLELRIPIREIHNEAIKVAEHFNNLL